MDWNAFIIPLTLIFTQLIKQTEIENKYLPWIAVCIGALLGLAWTLAQPQPEALTYLDYIVQGIIYGASAAGIYDMSSTFNAKNWRN